MASLARLRSRLPLKTTGRLAVSSFKIYHRRRSSHPVQPFARSLQTAADSTLLTQSIPQDPSTPFSVKLHEDSFRSFNTDTPSLNVEVTKDSLLKMYKEMVTMRRMEQSADALYKSKLIRGFCHLAIGQVRCALLLRVSLTYHIVPYFLSFRKPSQLALSRL
jgi:hypothetical protein